MSTALGYRAHTLWQNFCVVAWQIQVSEQEALLPSTLELLQDLATHSRSDVRNLVVSLLQVSWRTPALPGVPPSRLDGVGGFFAHTHRASYLC